MSTTSDVRLGHAGRHRAHAHLGDELHVHPGLGVRGLEVVDELGDVLDGVDVVVRGRGDQPDTGGGEPGLGDPGVDLVPRQLATLAGLGPLGDLDLEVVGVDEVLARDAEACRGDLLDGAAPQVAVGVGDEALGVLAPLAGVGLARPGGSSRWRGSRGPRRRSTRRTSRRSRSASRSPRRARPRRPGPGPAPSSRSREQPPQRGQAARTGRRPACVYSLKMS